MSVTNTCYLYGNVCFLQRFSYVSIPLTLRSSPFVPWLSLAVWWGLWTPSQNVFECIKPNMQGNQWYRNTVLSTDPLGKMTWKGPWLETKRTVSSLAIIVWHSTRLQNLDGAWNSRSPSIRILISQENLSYMFLLKGKERKGMSHLRNNDDNRFYIASLCPFPQTPFGICFSSLALLSKQNGYQGLATLVQILGPLWKYNSDLSIAPPLYFTV